MKLFEALSEVAVKEAETNVLVRLVSGPIVKAKRSMQMATFWLVGKSDDKVIEELKASSFICPEK